MPHPRRRPARPAARTLILTLALSAAAAALPACHLEPEVVGGSVFNTHTVSRGELFQVRLPVDKNETGKWRIESYDTQKLELVSPPALVTEGGSKYLRATLRAGAPGETKLIFGRIGKGVGSRLKTYKITVEE